MLADMLEKTCNVGETEWLYIKIVKNSFQQSTFEKLGRLQKQASK